MEEKLISIEELIKRAKSLGVDFGKGDPKNRLRYYTKLGLIPHAKRKCFQSRFPSGAYPESVLKTLLKIDKELKKGKTIQEIKKEFEKEVFKERKASPKKEFVFQKRKFLPAKKIIAFALLSLILFMLTATQKIKPKEFLSAILAVLQEKFKLAQVPSSPSSLSPETSSLSLEPYLTINAQTLVRPSLKAEEFLEAPNFLLSSGEFKGNITATLTGDRTYTFPDESGQICLSSGNCVRILGQVQTPGGETARLAKFISPNRIANSSIVDLFSGVLITIDEKGNIGIATETPRAKLEVVGDSIFVGKINVEGEIEATGDICTKLEGGKCLSELLAYYAGWGGGGGAAAGVGGSGTADYLAVWTGASSLGNSLLHQSGDTLYLPGDFEITGSLKVSTTSLPQLLLEYSNLNYLKFEIEENTTTISASSTLYINSLTGQIIASDATLTATSFVASDATVRSIGEYVFREAIPIFKYPVPAQTESTNFVQISRYFSSGETISSISKLKGSQRKYAFLINMADDIPTNSSSTWRIYRPSANATYTSFTIQGNAMASLEEGKPILTDFMDLPDDDWRLEVSVPSGKKLRVFNILLLVFDQVL